MNKIFNFRFFVITFLIAIAACAVAISFSWSKIFLIISFSSLFIVSAVLLILGIIKSKARLVYLFFCFVVAGLSFLNVFTRQVKLETNRVYDDETVTVIGRIVSLPTKTSSGNFALNLDSNRIIVNGTEREISGNVTLYVSGYAENISDSQIGRFVIATTKLKTYEISYDSTALNLLGRDVVMTGYVSASNFEILNSTKITLREKVKNESWNLIEKLNIKNGEVGYSMLFGDTTYLNDATISTMRAAGVAHLLAVSGFHVSIIMLILNFILRKLKSPKVVNLILIAAILGFYCYICNFSISVVRASVMTLMMLYSKLRGKAYDRFSALGLVGTFALILNPLKLFNASFILSFSSVLAIMFLFQPLTRVLNKFLYRPIAKTLSLTMGVQIGIIVTNAYLFNSFSIISIFSNLITVPIISFGFIVFIVAFVLTAIFPFLAFILKFSGMIFELGINFNMAMVSLIPEFNVEGTLIIQDLLFKFLMLFASDYIFIEKYKKVRILVAMFLVSTVFALFPI
ncbi:MAG: ComEC/Rec2 family competence protein [Clostridia bacterium]|nr:ComEC/Rec2 family competence protein [Clostridia bacterium]